jgi:sialate O-acetylesterase
MKLARSVFLLLCIVSLAALPTQAQQPAPTLRLPATLGDHMVIQRDTPARIWGWAKPGETVTIALGQASASAKADDKGEWSVTLDKLPAAGAPLELVVKDGTTTLTVRDVLVGDVWVCSGQSNMAFNLGSCASAPAELAAADRPQMRFFQVPGVSYGTPLADTTGKWVVCTPATAKGFSAVGYYFGREIQQSQKIPVGLIGSNQGASRAQVWLSREALAADPDLSKIYLQPFAAILDNPEAAKAAHEKWMKEGGAQYMQDRRTWYSERFTAEKNKVPFTKPMPQPPATPEPLNVTEQTGFSTVLFNARIHPLVNFPIRGALWYQGEGNTNDPLYDRLLTALITDWRTRWRIGDFPFLIVQLPNKSKQQLTPAEQLGGWAAIRDRQLKVHQTVPNVGIIPAIDLGSTEDPVENNNLHPVEKENIGKRLALAAGHYAYGEKGEFSGPILEKSTIEGTKIRLTFAHIGDGLKIGTPPKTSLTPQPPTDELRGFAIAGADKKFVAAKAVITGPGSVSVWSESVAQPAFVRYGWQLSPVVNLYNSADLPAFPFRTDTD